MSAAAIAVTGYGLSAIVESNDAAALSMLRRRLPLSIDVQLAPAGSTAQRHWVAPVLAGARGEAEATATELIEAARTVPPR